MILPHCHQSKHETARRHFGPAPVAIAAAVLWSVLPPAVLADEPLDAAIVSITDHELYDHAATLADDALEGRAVGSRGGYAAGQYIVQQLRPYKLAPAGADGDFFQPFDGGGRNILAVLPGTDPQLRQEIVVVGAHYDHVGTGREGHVNGPVGEVYNGADDNASGVAVLLEAIEAFSEARVRTRRSILFAFWDGEEKGLVGSKHWFTQPTVPIRSIRLAVNLDMVGRLRDGHLQVLGTRTGYGLRRLFGDSSGDSLLLDFRWELTGNSDHWPFVDHQIPVVMLHTGMHDDYHQPGDDIDKLNPIGMQSISRYLLSTLSRAADSDELPSYRPAGRAESLTAARRSNRSRVTRTASNRWPGQSPPRLGIAWRTDDAEPGSIILTHVAANSPAKDAGLAVDDRIYAIDSQPITSSDEFRKQIVGNLDAGVAEFTLLVESNGRLRNVTIRSQPPTLAANAPT